MKVKVPQDIRKYETKIIGPLSGRQLVLAAACLATILVVTLVASPFVPTSFLRFLQILPIIPFGAFMFIKPYEIPLEQFLLTVLYTMFLSPSKRKYANSNTYKSIAHKVALIEAEKAKKSKAKKQKTKKGGKS